jgi:hypothetical protein
MCGYINSNLMPGKEVCIANSSLSSSLQLTAQMWNTIQVIRCGVRAAHNKDISIVIYSTELLTFPVFLHPQVKAKDILTKLASEAPTVRRKWPT